MVPGDDRLYGGDGSDRLVDEAGGGRLYGGAGNDELSAGDARDSGRERWLYGGDGNDRLTGSGGPARLDGGPGDDTVAGGGVADVLLGGDGDDLLDLAGATRAYGGDGADLFLLAGNEEGVRKRIMDFDPAEDQLRFDAGGLSVSGTSIDLVDRGAGRLDDVRLRIEIGGGTVVQDLLLVGVDDTAGITVQFV